ncbi:hypothetical protein [Streptomyces sp. NPDC006739]|uniref:hypothetical protein n=1 Tax=Streptomyces sp. NPDC006739 TaxID=3364763 RepID=UPI0036A0D3D1
MRHLICADTGRITILQLSVYAPDLNPQVRVWSLVKRGLGSPAAADLSQITRAVQHQLKGIAYCSELIDGCLAGTGLITDG